MSARLTIAIQIASKVKSVPDRDEIESWIEAAVTGVDPDRCGEVSLRIVDIEEGQQLNKQYRGRDNATNVLSFPGEYLPDGMPVDLPRLLGDVVICGPIVEREAVEQRKSVGDHWAHLLVHGTLHLLGYDHEDAVEADEMEAVETRILRSRGVKDPYLA